MPDQARACRDTATEATAMRKDDPSSLPQYRHEDGLLLIGLLLRFDTSFTTLTALLRLLRGLKYVVERLLGTPLDTFEVVHS